MKEEKKMIKSIERDLYDYIISFFEQKPRNKEEVERWRYDMYIKLMNMMESSQKNDKKKILIRNAIILILALLNDIPPDSYNVRGTELDRIESQMRKEEILSELKGELQEK